MLVTIAAVAAVANARARDPVGGGVRARRGARADRPGLGRRRARPARRHRAARRRSSQGESLVNDGTGLTAYKIALAAVGGARRLRRRGLLEFVGVAAGGIAIGLAAGWVFAHLRRLVTDPSLDVTLSVLTPFVAYVPAEEVHVSGVLATVAAGLYVGSRSLDIIEPGTRLRTLAFWESTAFLLDGLLFLLIGVQVPTILERIEDDDAHDAEPATRC